jgi:hypothetical protein
LNTESRLSVEAAAEIAIEAYLYAFPLILMDFTRQVTTNVEAPNGFFAPVNQFAHIPFFPDATFTAVVRPNADTLYSSMHFNVENEPLIISVPASGNRYYMLPFLDKWTDVFACPGTRTTGNGEQVYALTGPGWQGTLPAGVTRLASPTAEGWAIGRTNTEGPADYPAVHAFQAGFGVVPLAGYGQDFTPEPAVVDPTISNAPPIQQALTLSPTDFFSAFGRLTQANPPHANDYSILFRLARLGIRPGTTFDPDSMSAVATEALEAAPQQAAARVQRHLTSMGRLVNGWRIALTGVGTYGTDYLSRAAIAVAGIGANTPEDAVYPSTFSLSDGTEFDSQQRYTLRFTADGLPPVRGFWSLTMYDERQLFADNPLNRYAIGDRDELAYGPDGSLELYIQRQSPGIGKESNWLPAPAGGSFTMNLRLYWPSAEVLDGSWSPPAVQYAG